MVRMLDILAQLSYVSNSMQGKGVFQKLNLIPYNNPIVYKVYLHGILIYIGASSHGLSRITDKHHILKYFLTHKAIKVEYAIFNSSKEAFSEEGKLIKELLPVINIVGKYRREVAINKHRAEAIAKRQYKTLLKVAK